MPSELDAALRRIASGKTQLDQTTRPQDLRIGSGQIEKLIGPIAQSGPKAGASSGVGSGGGLGIGGGLVKALKGVLETADLGRSVATSVVKEGTDLWIDAFHGEFGNRASLTDLIQQTADHYTGGELVQDLFPILGTIDVLPGDKTWKPLDNIAGFVFDLGLDPLMYVGIGEGEFAAKSAKEFAALAFKFGESEGDNVALALGQKIAKAGKASLNAEDMAKLSEIYGSELTAGLRLKVPGTGRAARRVGRLFGADIAEKSVPLMGANAARFSPPAWASRVGTVMKRSKFLSLLQGGNAELKLAILNGTPDEARRAFQALASVEVGGLREKSFLRQISKEWNVVAKSLDAAGHNGDDVYRALGSDVPIAGMDAKLWQTVKDFGERVRALANDRAETEFLAFRQDWQPAVGLDEMMAWASDQVKLQAKSKGGVVLDKAGFEQVAKVVAGENFMGLRLVKQSEYELANGLAAGAGIGPREQAFARLSEALQIEGKDALQWFNTDMFDAMPLHLAQVARRVNGAYVEQALLTHGIAVEAFPEIGAKVVKLGGGQYQVSAKSADTEIAAMVKKYDTAVARVDAKNLTAEEAKAAVEAHAVEVLDPALARAESGAARVQRLTDALDSAGADIGAAREAIDTAAGVVADLRAGTAATVAGFDRKVAAAAEAVGRSSRRVERVGAWLRNAMGRRESAAQALGEALGASHTQLDAAEAAASHVAVLRAELSAAEQAAAEAAAVTAQASRPLVEITAEITAVSAQIDEAGQVADQLVGYLSSAGGSRPRVSLIRRQLAAVADGTAKVSAGEKAQLVRALKEAELLDAQMTVAHSTLGLPSEPWSTEATKAARKLQKQTEKVQASQLELLHGLNGEASMAQGLVVDEAFASTVDEVAKALDVAMAELAKVDPQVAAAATRRAELLAIDNTGLLTSNEGTVWFHTAATDAELAGSARAVGDAATGVEGYLGTPLTSSKAAADAASASDQRVAAVTIHSENPRIYGVKPDVFPEAARDATAYGYQAGFDDGLGKGLLRDDMMRRALRDGTITPAEIVAALGDVEGRLGISAGELTTRIEMSLRVADDPLDALRHALDPTEIETAGGLRRPAGVTPDRFARNRLVDQLIGGSVEDGMRLPEAKIQSIADAFKASVRGEGYDSVVVNVNGDGGTWNVFAVDDASVASATIKDVVQPADLPPEALAIFKNEHMAVAETPSQAVAAEADATRELLSRTNRSVAARERAVDKAGFDVERQTGAVADARAEARTNKKRLYGVERSRAAAVERGDTKLVAALDQERTLRESADEMFAQADSWERRAATDALTASAASQDANKALLRDMRLRGSAAKAEADLLKVNGKLMTPTELIAGLRNANDFEPVKVLLDGWKQVGENGTSAVPDWILDGIMDTNQIWGPKGKSVLLDHFDAATNYFKAWAITTPGFHSRNFFGGVFNNALAGVDAVSYYRFRRLYNAFAGVENKKGLDAGIEAMRLSKYARANPEFADAFERAARTGVMAGGQTTEVSSLMAGKGHGVNLLRTNNLATHANTEMAHRVEANLRGIMAFDRAIKGFSEEGMIGDVFKFHFNYDDMSAFERGVARRFVPFYTWTRKNLPLQMEMILTNPKPYLVAGALKRNIEFGLEAEDLKPSWYGGVYNIQTGLRSGGSSIYLMPDLPFNDMFRVEDPVKMVTSSLNPWVKLPIELTSGVKFFTGAPFRNTGVEMPPAVGKLFGTSLLPALEKVGLVHRNNVGKWLTADKNWYAIQSVMPALARLDSLFPDSAREKQKSRAKWNLVNFATGAGFRVNNRWEQQGELGRRKRERSVQRSIDRSFQ